MPMCTWLQDNLACAKSHIFLFFPIASEMLITIASLIMPHKFSLIEKSCDFIDFACAAFHHTLHIPAVVCSMPRMFKNNIVKSNYEKSHFIS